MNTRQRLHRIQDLNAAKHLQMMTDAQVELYSDQLNEFVESFPEMEAELKEAMAQRDIESVTKQLTAIRETLLEIHATELAEECWTRLNSFHRDKPERIEAFVVFFLSMLAALSIDIQMAFLAEDEDERYMGTDMPEDIENKSILAVDDDAFFLDIFKAALNDIPCKIIGVTSAQSALDVLNVHTPDLFALDIEMPDMNGIELAQEIKSRGQKAPIIFITGNATKEYVSKCVNAGAVDFIIKPLNPQYAVGRILKILR